MCDRRWQRPLADERQKLRPGHVQQLSGGPVGRKERALLTHHSLHSKVTHAPHFGQVWVVPVMRLPVHPQDAHMTGWRVSAVIVATGRSAFQQNQPLGFFDF